MTEQNHTGDVAQPTLTQEDVYANCWTTLIGFSNELTERDRKFICDQIALKVILAAQPPDAPVETDRQKLLDALPLQFQDGPDYCTVRDARGKDFALTVQPDILKEMESALRVALVASTPVSRSSAGNAEERPVSVSRECRRFMVNHPGISAAPQQQSADRAADLTDAQLDDLRSHIRGSQPSETGAYEYELGSGWRCFHCGEMFRTWGGASLHFGKPTDKRPTCLSGAQPQSPSLLDWLATKLNYELSYEGWDEEPEWVVHSVHGGRNDREWTRLASGSTPAEALQKAMSLSLSRPERS